MILDSGDQVIWGGQLGEKDQVVVMSERGYGKRVLAMEFERQNRNGKGVKIIYFNKNGSNGHYLAGVVKAGEEPCEIIVKQKQSQPTVLQKDAMLLQGKQDRGMPYVMAILDDVVTELCKR